MLIVFDGCIQHLQCAQNGAFIARRVCVIHKRAISVRIIYALEKTIYGLKKSIYGLERLFMGWKRLFMALTWFLQNSEFIFDHITHF